jgi:hypothetical protein
VTAGNGDWLAGLDATDEERLAFLEVLDEVEAEEAGQPPPYGGDDDDEPDGPWHDQLHAVTAAVDTAYAADAQRAAEDITDSLDRRPSAEAKMARAIRRVEAGTYLPPDYFRPARDAGGRFSASCGEPDEFGRCSARYHAASCHVITEEAAATGSPESARAWDDVLSRHVPASGTGTASALWLASPSGPQPGEAGDTWADLLRGDGLAVADVHAAMLAELGEAGAPPGYPREPLPDVRSIAEGLGLR